MQVTQVLNFFLRYQKRYVLFNIVLKNLDSIERSIQFRGSLERRLLSRDRSQGCYRYNIVGIDKLFASDYISGS